MLSHHEFAALVLVSGCCSEPAELDGADVEALLAHELVTLESHGPNRTRPQITVRGCAYLKALGRVRA